MLKNTSKTTKAAWISVGILAIANIAYQFVASSQNADSIAQAQPIFLLFAVISQICAYLVLVPSFRYFLAKHDIYLPFFQTLGILFAGLGLSKVLPAGEYILWRQRLKQYPGGVGATSQYIVIFYVWMFSGLVGLFLVSELLTAIFYPSQQVGLLARSFSIVPLFFTALIFGIVIASRFKSFRKKCIALFKSKLGTDTLSPRSIIEKNKLGKKELGWLTFGALFTWISEAITLFLCLSALGIEPPLIVTLFGYCFARLFSIVPILPGGIGEVEAATTLFFVSYGYAAGPVFTATVLFRLLTYWLPILFGASTYALGKNKKQRA